MCMATILLFRVYKDLSDSFEQENNFTKALVNQDVYLYKRPVTSFQEKLDFGHISCNVFFPNVK